jgi:hypothetical protein
MTQSVLNRKCLASVPNQSPKFLVYYYTRSLIPRMATTSANMCPLDNKSKPAWGNKDSNSVSTYLQVGAGRRANTISTKSQA